MSPTPKKFSAADIVVIVTLWTLQIYDDWLSFLFKHSSDVISGELKESEFYQIADLCILIGKCVLACALAVIVDAYNHKYAVTCGGMSLSIITPVLALAMCISENRRMVVLTLCASSLLFVTKPAAFGVIFNQGKRPFRIQVRRLVSIMEFIHVLLIVVAMEVIPENSSHSEQYSMIASWVSVVPFIIFIITILERIKKYVRPEALRERGVVAVFKGIRDDVSGKPPKTGQTKLNVLVFALLLLPAFSLTFLTTHVSNLKFKHDNQFQHPSLKRIVRVAELTVIPIAEVAVSYAPLKEIVAEMLVIGLAHVFNIGVLTVLCVIGVGRRKPVLKKQPPDNHSISNLDSITTINSTLSTFDDPFDSAATLSQNKSAFPAGRFVFFIVNHGSTEVRVQDRLGILFSGFKTLHRCNDSFTFQNRRTISGNITLTISITPRPRGSSLNQRVTFKEQMLRYIGIRGNASRLFVSLGGDDVNVPQFLDPSLSMVVLQNTIVGNSYSGRVMKPLHQVHLMTYSRYPLALVMLPRYSKSLTLLVQPTMKRGEKHRFEIRYVGGDPLLRQKLKKLRLFSWIECRPLTVVVVSFGLCELGPKYTPYSISSGIIHTAKPLPPTPAPIVPRKPDALVATTFAVLGATLGMTNVGYIHFFWMGAPIRLRSTLYAWFIVSNTLLEWVAIHVISHEIGLEEAIFLVFVTIVTAIWHFAFGWYYEHNVTIGALSQWQHSEKPKS